LEWWKEQINLKTPKTFFEQIPVKAVREITEQLPEEKEELRKAGVSVKALSGKTEPASHAGRVRRWEDA
jgi:hypothetical protein